MQANADESSILSSVNGVKMISHEWEIKIWDTATVQTFQNNPSTLFWKVWTKNKNIFFIGIFILPFHIKILKYKLKC